MSDGRTFKIQGLAEVTERLKKFPELVRTRILKRAIASGARVIKDTAKNIAPIGNYLNRRTYTGKYKQAGTLKKSIIVKYISRQSNEEQATYIVTVLKGKNYQKTNRDAYYASWVEFGHKNVPRGVTRSGTGRKGTGIGKRRRLASGRTEGVHYLEKAFGVAQGRALLKVRDELTNGIKKEVKKWRLKK